MCCKKTDYLRLEKEMYGRKASELVKELASSEPGQLAAFDNDLFAQVVEECNGHLVHLQSSLLRKIQEEGSDSQTTRNADHFGALIHHLSLVRNKRCLMAYVYNRAEVIRSLGWTVECVLPEEIGEKLSTSEKEYFKNHSATLQAYMAELDLDLAVVICLFLDGSLNCRIKKVNQGSLDDSTVIDVSTTEVQKVPRMQLRGWNVFRI
ncbi:unnamed protein product [Ilex paraguariensis]|uniref:GINS subunit domain-containing protein n=1 Tax=Ilex paraguariensis TaxID=185542 RepID=A0ABC8RTW2_9AQUA